MIRDFGLGCQYWCLRTNPSVNRTSNPTLVRQETRGQLKLADRKLWSTSKRPPRIVSKILYTCERYREPQCSFVDGMNGHDGAGEPREFVTTRWSVILSAARFGNEEQKARDALAELCRTYWRPIFSFVRWRGYSIEDAQDLTQDF